MFKGNNKDTKRCQQYRSGVFIVNFEHISHLVLVFLLLTLNRKMPAGMPLVLPIWFRYLDIKTFLCAIPNNFVWESIKLIIYIFLWARNLIKMDGVKENYWTTFYTLNLGLFVNIKIYILKIEFLKFNSRLSILPFISPKKVLGRIPSNIAEGLSVLFTKFLIFNTL